VFDGLRMDMAIAREEIFGPVLSNKAHGLARALRAGTVHVNQHDEDDITVPFGGLRQSGVGRDKSLHAFDKYTETKITRIHIDSPV
jgi:gamma-glutamyl-gamma-aminobutyraldehyde dehydrogenase/4-guanidinobutyraldehyde dehydrogenase/NAD-dependent aldehyde dehydrogenase